MVLLDLELPLLPAWGALDAELEAMKLLPDLGALARQFFLGLDVGPVALVEDGFGEFGAFRRFGYCPSATKLLHRAMMRENEGLSVRHFARIQSPWLRT
jgi:hypothetical protein